MVYVCSNAGKYVSANGCITVNMSIVMDHRFTPYLALTVSNTRLESNKIPDCEAVFVPFKSRNNKGHNRDTGWMGMTASDEYVHSMQQLWERCQPPSQHKRETSVTVQCTGQPTMSPREVDSLVEGESGDIPPEPGCVGTPVTTSTGLGLPLCRAFALSGGGWAGMEESLCGLTRFWAVVEVDAVHTQRSSAAAKHPSSPSIGLSASETLTVGAPFPSTPSTLERVATSTPQSRGDEVVVLSARAEGLFDEYVVRSKHVNRSQSSFRR